MKKLGRMGWAALSIGLALAAAACGSETGTSSTGGTTGSTSGSTTSSGSTSSGGAMCPYLSDACVACRANCKSSCTSLTCLTNLMGFESCVCAAQDAMDQNAANQCVTDFSTDPSAEAYTLCTGTACANECS
jgi:hypothetical protein